MKHRSPVPFPDDAMADIGQFVRRYGWEVRSYEIVGMGVYRYGMGAVEYLRITIVPQPDTIQAADMRMTVTSGSTLVYDDAEGTMGVTQRPEPQDAVPEPEDAKPAWWSLCCPGCGRLWQELPRLHMYGQNIGCTDVHREDAVPAPELIAELFAEANNRPEHAESVTSGLFRRRRR